MSFDDSICEMQLLAKDGVYLPAAPRAVNELPLSPGARADVAVYCSEAGAANLVSTGRRRQLQGRLPGGGGTTTGGGGQTATAGKWTGVALTVVASGAHAGQASAVPSFAVTRPCYLASTLGATADTVEAIRLGPLPNFNRNRFSGEDSYEASFAAGSLVQLEVSGVLGTGGHPFHTHVNPYQIVQMTPRDSTYYQVGDWHDTIYDGRDTAVLRFYADTFTGKMVMHCHFLNHEDEGMMVVYQITGNEGDVYAKAETLDPTCYRGADGRGSQIDPSSACTRIATRSGLRYRSGIMKAA